MSTPEATGTTPALPPCTPGTQGVDRRRFLLDSTSVSAAAALLATVPAGVRNAAWAAGSDAPEKRELKVGFIPLTDCASVVIASVLRFDEKYGIRILPAKEASWASVRDKLVNGELDASHVLTGLLYGQHLGIGGIRKPMALLMNLNHNGQAITLARKFADGGVRDGPSLKHYLDKNKAVHTFAHTFPTGTHAMWLYYWLAANGIDPMRDVRTIVVPPPQMVANMRVANMDGFCVGEPWNNRAIVDRIGFTAVTSQQIWKDHPEKALGTTAEFVQRYPNSARALVAAILDASRFIDVMANRKRVADIIADKSWVNCPPEIIDERLQGRYDNGIGNKWNDPDYMKFHNDGRVNYPYLSDGLWFLTQHRRWGLLKDDPDYLAVAREVNRIGLYKDAATLAKVSLPTSDFRVSRLFDGNVWDGKDPKAYASSFKIRA